jgi:tRNA threonylcarbamoyl adenosine modification protein YeaZ
MNAAGGALLTLETSGDVCSIAITEGEALQAELIFRHGMHLSERLMGHIREVLAAASTGFETVDAFAVGIGPGSFTGTRIGVMTMKMLAAATEKPLYGVNGLEALAAAYAALRDTVLAPLIPCRPGVVYSAAYAVEGSESATLVAPAASPLAELAAALQALEPRRILLCGPSVRPYGEELSGLLRAGGWEVWLGAEEWPRASVIGKLAAGRHRLRNGDPLELLPLYLSPPPITLPKTPFPGLTSSRPSPS